MGNEACVSARDNERRNSKQLAVLEEFGTY